LDILEKNGFNFNEFTNVLDFGCGCGRVIRNWYNYKPSFYGADYNSELIFMGLTIIQNSLIGVRTIYLSVNSL